MECSDGCVEIRMIGPLEVRRPDGGLVRPAEWGSAKTRDLLRLLVLDQGRVVPTEGILRALWPGVDRAHGAASIRTAASRIRAATRSPCVRREAGGLRVEGTRSDVGDLRELAKAARRRHAAADHAGILRLVARHDRLTRGQLQAEALSSRSEGDHSWARQARDEVAGLQHEVLTILAESRKRVAELEDMLDVARWAIGGDPYWERPYRVLMQALVELGEHEEALKVYERLEEVLLVERGQHPSARTRLFRESIQWALPPVPADEYDGFDAPDDEPRTGLAWLPARDADSRARRSER
jgi:pentatricopeptide repeat protein